MFFQKNVILMRYKCIFKIEFHGFRFYIKLPDLKPYPDTSFCAVVYNCRIEMISSGEIINEFGKDMHERGESIGNNLINIRLHDNVFGEKLILRCVVSEGTSITKLENARLMHTEFLSMILHHRYPRTKG